MMKKITMAVAAVGLGAAMLASAPATANPPAVDDAIKNAGRSMAQGLCAGAAAKGGTGSAVIASVACGEAFDVLDKLTERGFDAFGEWWYGPLWPKPADQFIRINQDPPTRVEPQS